MKARNKINSKLLTIASLLTVGLHLLAGYGMSGLKITRISSEHLGLMENRTARDKIQEHHEIVSQDEEKKNAILAEAFKKLYNDNYREPNTFSDLNEAEFTVNPFDDHMNLSESSTSKFSEAIVNDQLAGLEQTDILESLRESSSELSLPNELTQLIHTDEERLARDIIQATESQHGMVIDDTISYYTELPAIQLGIEEASFDEGNFLQDRSGLLEGGRTDLEANNEAGILLDTHDHDKELIAYVTREEIKNSLASTQIKSSTTSDPWYVPSVSDRQATIGHIASSEDFHVNVEVAPLSQGKGYLFKIELNPKQDIPFRRIKQNITFLIDRSYSIEKERFKLTKQAVSDAIRALSPEDNFNIIVFDQNVTKLANQPIPRTADNVERADRFLNQEQHGSMLTATDVTSPLNEIIPKAVAENEINTAILLSDGDTTLNPIGQWETIREWTEENNGKVALYTVASGQKNNYPMLDIMSVFNKGNLHIAKNHQEIQPTLSKLMKQIQTPIGKNIVPNVIPKNETTTIRTYPNKEHLPNLYDKNSLTLHGYTNSLDDFYLFFQGHYYDKRINIKQLISLRNERKVNPHNLEKAWAIQSAYDLCKKYLNDGNEKHLHQAKQLLHPYNLSIGTDYEKD